MARRAECVNRGGEKADEPLTVQFSDRSPPVGHILSHDRPDPRPLEAQVAMRFPVIAALLGATLLTPAAAIAQDGRGGRAERQQARAERQQVRPERQQARAERRQARPERPQQWRGAQPAGVAPTQAREERREARGDFRQERREDRGAYRQERREDRQDFRRDQRGDRPAVRNGDATVRQYRSDRADARRDFRQDRRDDARDFRADRRDDRQDWQRGRADWNGGRGIAGRGRDRDWNGDRGWNDNRAWNRGWRAESRYDWRANRYRNRAAYRLPRYYAPSGWRSGYQRFGIGVTLSSFLWGQNYWINDPFSYRLPDTWGPYRWVRYYNDALLVDVRSGRVVDVEYDIFW